MQNVSDQWQPPDLSDRVAAVCGATRGVGRGIAEVLGACGAFVYVTGRSTRANAGTNPERTVEAVAESIVESGGRAVGVVCDHRRDEDTEALFERIRKEQRGLDILVNNQIGWGDTPSDDAYHRRRLWQRPMSWWDDNFDAGVRGHVANCHFGIPLMLDRGNAIVLFTSERAVDDAAQVWDAVYDLRATATARMVKVLAEQLRPRRIPVVLLYPGWTRTEEQIDTVKAGEYPPVGSVDELVEKTASPHYAGRAAASLAGAADAMDLTGSIQSAHRLAQRYGFTDVDGRRPDAK
ncbi:MAG: SDR family oxidoreductase [Gammaproteobacteria bacterium]|jgi:NAD(P)-dependent dehydrogenase (short-subunit alcohol dehydrogenase family)